MTFDPNQQRAQTGDPNPGAWTTAPRCEGDVRLGLEPPRAALSVDDVCADLAAMTGEPCADAKWQLIAALEAYRQATGVDLTGRALVLETHYPVDTIDPGYNFTPDSSVAEYEARWVASGRLVGEDLECQVWWYTQLVDAARAGVLPPVLIHETNGKRVIVDGGHRLSAHRAAGLTTVAAYVAR